MAEGTKAIIKLVDMPDKQIQDAVNAAAYALKNFEAERDMAAFVKKEFDKTEGPTWHCFVGKNFGAYMTHETKHYIYFYLGTMAFLLFKSG